MPSIMIVPSAAPAIDWKPRASVTIVPSIAGTAPMLRITTMMPRIR